MGDGMRERPILMTPENAQKCHDGTKTQTRRIVKPQPGDGNGTGRWTYTVSSSDRKSEDQWNFCEVDNSGSRYTERGKERVLFAERCPYGVYGDRLWVREAHRIIVLENEQEITDYKGAPVKRMRDILDMSSWLPSIHMRREHCRTVLEITGVRVERLKDISPADALAEGVFCPEVGYAQHGERAPVLLYGFLWESIHGAGSWAQNPWVWVISFRKVGA